MSKIRKISTLLFKIVRLILMFAGGMFLLLSILALTSLPFWARNYLARTEAGVPMNTESILVMGGGGFPSESVLIRLWYTAELANKFPNAKVIVTTPGHFADSTSTVFQMYQYLLKCGIDSERILIESEGLNTRHQALLSYEMFQNGMFQEPLVIVSSPSHIYRSVKSFRKAGFNTVSGKPSVEIVLETDLRIDDKLLGGNELMPAAPSSITLRYKFWDYLKYEVEVVREYIAIVYYKLKGWV